MGLTGEQQQTVEAWARAREARERAQAELRWGELAELDAVAAAAWEQVAAAFGAETVLELDDVPQCDTGAPLPLMVADGSHVWLSYDTGEMPRTRVVLRFDGADSVLFGGPNDESLTGHRLSERGLDWYAFHEVIASEWVAARERENSVHDRHRPGWHAWLRHFVFTFHDETFECLARSYARQNLDDLPDALATVLGRAGSENERPLAGRAPGGCEAELAPIQRFAGRH